jgi:hypothetical protein
MEKTANTNQSILIKRDVPEPSESALDYFPNFSDAIIEIILEDGRLCHPGR